MRKTTGRQPITCSKCPRITDQPRKGLCFACYQREWRNAALPENACCQRCSETDPLVLRVTPFGVLCANDHARARAVA
jgi:NMD protein affecting ribosome stability and mRNA decay